MKADDFIIELAKYSSDQDAVFLQRFFKTAPGQYGAGDQFIGVRVPKTRLVCKLFQDLPTNEVQKLFDSPIHEHRLGAAIILANKYLKANEVEKQKIFDMYLKNVAENKINNWDIVDVTCEYVVGAHLIKDKRILYQLAKSDNLWEKRIAIVSTFAYIKKEDPAATLEIAEILLNDKHDLIQKATGWMLREVGKRVDEKLLTGFLDRHAHEMPRTMLRYSIERLSPEQKQKYMNYKLAI